MPKKKKLWLVRIGGTPPNASMVVTQEHVEEALIEMAEMIAKQEGIDPQTIGIYGGPGDPVGWGACPEGDDGAFWPYAVPLGED